MRLASKISKGFVYIGAAGMFVMMMITVIDVVMRYIIKHTIPGAPELAEFLMIFVIFLTWAYCADKRSHVAVGILVEKFPKKVQKGLELSLLLPTLLVYGFMAWRMWVEVFQQRSVSTVLRIPKAPFYFIMCIGVFLLCVALIKLIIEDVTFFTKKREGQDVS